MINHGCKEVLSGGFMKISKGGTPVSHPGISGQGRTFAEWQRKERISYVRLGSENRNTLDVRSQPFLSHITCYKLASVVLRRKYLASMAAVAEPDGILDESVLAPAGFWNALAQDMVKRTWDLITTLEDFFRIRGTKLGFAPIL
jgi:hypothetical protein